MADWMVCAIPNLQHKLLQYPAFETRAMSDTTCAADSKGGISIPPPRPKRKPMHPYPRKNGDTGTETTTTAQQRTEQPQQPSLGQAAAGPSSSALPALPSLDSRGGEPSLSQVLEAAAVAAATAWSRVVDSAGTKVQQQLQVIIFAVTQHCVT